MRTNIDIDRDLVARVMRNRKLPTIRAAVEAGLRKLDEEDEGLAMAEWFRQARGSGWTGDLDAMRRDKPRP